MKNELLRRILSNDVMHRVDDLRDIYSSAFPFPHVVIDDFFRPEVASYLYANFPKMEDMPNVFKEPMSYKGQLSDIDGRWPKFSKIFESLQSDEFRSFISHFSGVKDLIADEILAGGGMHQSPSNGFLDIHVDANFHPINKELHRRINIIIYVNKEWCAEWGGNLQLWSDSNKKPDKLTKEVMPKFNRAVIFNTDRTSWHGVGPVDCPVGESRKSLALYYYTKDRPYSELYQDSSVIWMNKSSLSKKIMYPLMNFGIRLLKPYAKYLRRNVFDAKKGK